MSQNAAHDLDILVLGGGIAGMVAALSATSRARVCLVTAGDLEAGCTHAAQGGMAAALGEDDSAALHAADTLAAGRGLSDARRVRVLTDEAPLRIQDLEGFGVSFDRDDLGRIALGREAAHACRRIVHAGGDATGARVSEALARRLNTSPVRILEHHIASRLLVDEAGRCVGAEVIDSSTGMPTEIIASATIVATGGAAGLWQHTTNPDGATGSGVALAYAIGAEVEAMEFMQFHPTAMAHGDGAHFLISEAVRGEGAVLLNRAGERFMTTVDPLAELAARDVVARAIYREVARQDGEPVVLDCRPLGPRMTERFPTIVAGCLERGIDPLREPIPVAPAAHYTIGGVRTDADGASTIGGLYAVGEVASTRIHGANRLASNSLIEGAVFGRRAADAALRRWGEAPPPVWPRAGHQERMGSGQRTDADAQLERLRRALWQGAGIERDAAGLREAQRTINDVSTGVAEGATMAENRVAAAATVARLVVEAALTREESRGAHVRVDHPEQEENWHGTVVMHRERGVRLDRNTQSNH